MRRVLIILFIVLCVPCRKARAHVEAGIVEQYWQVGIGLGELPVGGSFKPSITIGYHFNGELYIGLIYQVSDRISRGADSFNAQAAGLEGLLESAEKVAQRFMVQLRYTPFENGPYLSGGLVYNGTDSERMVYDARARSIAGENHQGSVIIEQSRPAGWGLALGPGYQYDFDAGFSLNTEWTPAWFQYPDPEYSFSGGAELSSAAQALLQERMDKEFTGTVSNLYKIFHIGVSFRFQ